MRDKPAPVAAAARVRSLAANFYASVIDAADLADVARANHDGVDAELQLMRFKLRELMRDRPEDHALMLKSVELIVRIVAARYRMSATRTEELDGTMSAMVRSVMSQFYPERFTDV